MKKISIVYSILKNNIFANGIIIFQIFIILFNILPNYNIMKANIKFIEIAKNSSLDNALYYMNEELVEYIDKDNNRKTNLSILINNKKRLEEIARKDRAVKTITPYRMKGGYFVDGITAEYRIYDSETLNIMKPYLDEGKLPNSKDIAEVVLIKTEETKNKKLGDIIELKSDKGRITVKVSGIINESEIDYIDTTFVSNTDVPISKIFNKVRYKDTDRLITFITDNNEYIKKILEEDNFYSFQQQAIIYFKDDATNIEKINFIEKIKKENLGYFISVKDMIVTQEQENSYMIYSKVDYFSMLFLIIIVSLISISFYIQKKFRKNTSVYLLNGASKKDIFIIFLYYFLFIYIIAILIYFTFVNMGKMGMFGDSIYFSDIIYNFSVNIKEFILISLFVLFVFMLVAYLPIFLLDNNRVINMIKE